MHIINLFIFKIKLITDFDLVSFTTKGENMLKGVINNKSTNFISCAIMFVFVLFQSNIGLLFSLNSTRSRNNSIAFKDNLSYGQKNVWFVKSNWKKKPLTEVFQSRQRQPWVQSSWESTKKYFIESLRKGDKNIFKFVEYGVLDGYINPYSKKSVKGYPSNLTHSGKRESNGVISDIYHEAKSRKMDIKNFLTNGNSTTHNNVVQAILGGIENKDPRVRLVAINLLRFMGPSESLIMPLNKAISNETVTTERSKWREKDLDRPSIEMPSLGYAMVAWRGKNPESSGSYDIKTYTNSSIRDLWQDGSQSGYSSILDGNGKGRYLSEGIFKDGDMSHYPVYVTRYNNVGVNSKVGVPTKKDNPIRVWSKASLLRYGADNHVSGFEVRYGLSEKEVMPKYTYISLSSYNPENNSFELSKYYGLDNPFIELIKLKLYCIRELWVNKVLSGDISVLKNISKDSFRALADQIDGESLDNVPMKSKSFKIFGSDVVSAIIVCMLENRVVSTREECARFLIRLYQYPDTSDKIKKQIVLALKEARRRELLIDTIRGRHLHAVLTSSHSPVSWWGENDEIDSSIWTSNKRALNNYKSEVSFPDENEIYYSKSIVKPGQEDVVNSSGLPLDAKNSGTDSIMENCADSSFELICAAKTSDGALSYKDLGKYLGLSKFLNIKTNYKKLIVDLDNKSNFSLVLDNSRISSAFYALYVLLSGEKERLLKTTYADMQNAMLMLQFFAMNDLALNKKYVFSSSEQLNANIFMEYFVAASIVFSNDDVLSNFRNSSDFVAKGVKYVKKCMNDFLGALSETLSSSKYRILYSNIAMDLSKIKAIRSNKKLYPDKFSDASIDSYVPAGSSDYHVDFNSYDIYEKQLVLPQSINDNKKLLNGFYRYPLSWDPIRNSIVRALLVSLGSNDARKQLLSIHLLRRLIPDSKMLSRVNSLLSSIAESNSISSYNFFDTYVSKNKSTGMYIRLQDKVLVHEALKLQRFIVRRLLVNNISSGNNRDILKNIPKGSFLSLITRIDAEWAPFRIPLRTVVSRSSDGSNGMFFTAKDILSIKSGLDNKNFIVQREVANWIVSYFNNNYGTPSFDSSYEGYFVDAVRYAQKKDIVYYERNYSKWKYTDNSFSKTTYVSDSLNKGISNVMGVPFGRVGVALGTMLDSIIFKAVDLVNQNKYNKDTQNMVK